MKLCFVLIYLVGAVLLASPSHARTLEIVTLEIPPFVVRAKDGSAGGPASQVVRETLRRAGFRADISVVPWKRGIMMVDKGQADGVFPVSKSAQRLENMLYPEEPITSARVIVLADPARDLRMDLDGTGTDGLVVGMLRGGSHGPKLEEFLSTARFSRIETVPFQKQGALMTLRGRQDAFIIIDTIIPFLQTVLEQGRSLEIVRTPTGEPFVIDEIKGYMAFSKTTMDEASVSRISSALQEMKQDGTFDRLMGKRRRASSVH